MLNVPSKGISNWEGSRGALSRTWFGPLCTVPGAPCLPRWRGLRAAVSAWRTPVPVASPQRVRVSSDDALNCVSIKAQRCLSEMPMVGLWVPVLPFLSQMSSAAQATKLLCKGWHFAVSLAEHFSFHASHRPENSIWRRLTSHKLKIRLVSRDCRSTGASSVVRCVCQTSV